MKHGPGEFLSLGHACFLITVLLGFHACGLL